MFDYFIILSIIWAIGLSLYYLLLRRVPSHRFNRVYLLAVLVGGLVVPLLPTWGSAGYALIPDLDALRQVWLPETTVLAEGGGIENSFSINWLYWIVGICYACSIGYFISQAVALLRLHRHSKLLEQSFGMDVREVSPLQIAPCSFASSVYVSDWNAYSANDKRSVLAHESAHFECKHTADVVLINLCAALLWFHPLVHIIRRELRLVHEYEADAYALQQLDPTQYRLTLLTQQLGTNASVFAASFNHSPLKLRFQMINRVFQRQQIWRLSLAALSLVLVGVACTKEDITDEDIALLESVNDGESFSDAALDVTGMNLIGVDTISTFDPATSTEVVTLVQRYEGPNNKTKTLTRTLTEDVIGPSATQVRNQKVYKVVEQMPRFPLPSDCGSTAPDQCATKAMLEHVYSNITYPSSAREAGIEGTGVVTFVVGTDGELLELKVVRNPAMDSGGSPINAEAADEIEQELLKVVESMPAWSPGQQDGKPVQVQFNLPVRFKLG